MPFATIKRWLRDDAKPTTSKPTGLRVDRLDDRIVPAASLFDLNSSFLGGGNQPSNILGQSDDGRYVIFESKATDLIVGQQDIPNTNDLFWRDLQTGDTRMVTALPVVTQTNYDYAATRLAPQSFALQSVVDGGPAPLQSFGRAVISGDGLFVGISTTANASRLDQQFANSTYAPFSNDTTVYDVSNTLDVFRWSSKTGELDLASRTAASKDTGGKVLAFGRFGSSDTPAISRDGSYVGFASSVDAWYLDTRGQPTALGAGIIVDAGNTVDVFATYYDFDNTTTTEVISATLTTPIDANSPIFIRTYGHASGTDVRVDPQGRYLSVDAGGGLFIVGTAAVDPTAFFGTGYSTKTPFFLLTPLGNITTLTVNPNDGNSNYEAWRWGRSGGLKSSGSGDLITDDNITTIGTDTNFFFDGVTINGGHAQSIIIAPDNPFTMLVSTSTVGNNNGDFTTPGVPGNVNRQDLFYVRRNTLGTITQSVTNLNGSKFQPSILSNDTIADPTQHDISQTGEHVVYTLEEGFLADGITAKTQVFYRKVFPVVGAAERVSVTPTLQPLSQGANTPRVSGNGRLITFSSTTPADQFVAGVTDTNGVSDVFVRDRFAVPTFGGKFTAVTQLVSSDSTNLAAAGGVSRNAFVATVNTTPFNQINFGSPEDALGRIVFNSTAQNIDPNFVPGQLGFSSFVLETPIGGLPPVVPPTDAPRTGVVSGGRDAGIAQISFVGAGTVVFGQRLTPYPGFTGEIRVASADFNNDGVLDTAVAPGAGLGPRIIVFNGANDKVLFDFFAYENNFRGGVNIAAADMNGDGRAELVLGADKGGGARVRVLDLANSKTLADYFAYDSTFRGGVRVATGDFDGDGVIDILTGAGSGGGPRVTAFSGANIVADGTLNRFIDFFAMDLNLRDGVFVAGGDMNNDGVDDIVVGAGAGGGPRVRVFESVSVRIRPTAPDLLYDFFASDPNGRAGVRVAVKNVDGDGTADIVTGNGFGSESRVRSFSGAKLSAPLTPSEINNTFIVFNDVSSLNGAWVG